MQLEDGAELAGNLARLSWTAVRDAPDRSSRFLSRRVPPYRCAFACGGGRACRNRGLKSLRGSGCLGLLRSGTSRAPPMSL